MRFAALVVSSLMLATSSHASIISQLLNTDPTPNSAVLQGSLLLDAASLGGGDTNSATAAQSTIRSLDLDGAPGAPGAEGMLTIKGFAFASANNIPAPVAGSLMFTFTYLGADGIVGTDDVLIGSSEAVVFNDGIGNGTGFEGVGRYYVNFDSPPSASIDGLNENFLITITPSSGAIRFKTTGSGAQPLSAAKFSVSGDFAVVPEPASLLVFAVGSAGAFVESRRRSH